MQAEEFIFPLVDEFEMLYQDEYLVAVHKPYGYFVHRSKLDFQAHTLVLPQLRDQLGQFVYPVHRLDRKTHGVLLFALDSNTQRIMNAQFAEGQVKKEYLAIVRGYTDDKGTVDYDLINDRNQEQKAITHYTTLSKVEVPLQSHVAHPTSRYSLVALHPDTGRQHQLRKHMSHIFHPIIADRPHGCSKQNRFFLKEFELKELLLYAKSITFSHPITNEETTIISQPSSEFIRIANVLGLKF